MQSQIIRAATAETGAQDRTTEALPASSSAAPHLAAKSIRTVIKPRAPQVLQSMNGWGSHTEPAQLSFNFTRS